jgi:hypothetical protein
MSILEQILIFIVVEHNMTVVLGQYRRRNGCFELVGSKLYFRDFWVVICPICRCLASSQRPVGWISGLMKPMN